MLSLSNITPAWFWSLAVGYCLAQLSLQTAAKVQQWKGLCPHQWLCHLFNRLLQALQRHCPRKRTLPRYCPRHTSEFAPSISHTCLMFFLTFFWNSLLHIFMHTWKSPHHTEFLTFYLAKLLASYLAFHLPHSYLAFFSDILSATVSDVLSATVSDVLSDILSGISSDILSVISSDILSVISSDILSGISFGGWGPAANTGRGWSWLRSGSEPWAWMVVVEVRQRTLGVASRGWGPAANTGRGWSWLRSGSAHWAWMVVVEVQGGGRRRRRRRCGS